MFKGFVQESSLLTGRGSIRHLGFASAVRDERLPVDRRDEVGSARWIEMVTRPDRVLGRRGCRAKGFHLQFGR